MRRLNIAYTIGGVALAALILSSCTRDENIDNLNVITKPYSLHFADSAATLYATNDGQHFSIIPNQQGRPIEAIATSGEYLLFRMQFSPILFVDDAGEGINNNFNPSFTDMNPAAYGNSAILNLPGYNDTGAIKKDRLYVAAGTNKGIAYNDSNGKSSAWFYVNDPELGTSVTSFTKLEDSTLVAFDDVSRSIWTKDDLTADWKRKGASGLPAGGGTDKLMIINQKNDIIAVSINTGIVGGPAIWRSTDKGATFKEIPLTGINEPIVITGAAAPFGKVLVITTINTGVFRLSGQGVWEKTTFGLKNDLYIFGITSKNNKFKNGKAAEYLFIGTTDGVYRSDDLGQNWIRLDIPTYKPIMAIH